MSNKQPKYVYAVVGKNTNEVFGTAITRSHARVVKIENEIFENEPMKILQIPLGAGQYVR